jgi:hypothetical protein
MSNMRPASGQGPLPEKTDTARRLGSVAWAVFFIWVGIAMLGNFPWGWFLLGVGMLILAVQFVRWFMGMSVEGFWVACATVFIAGGLMRRGRERASGHRKRGESGHRTV